MTPDLPEKVLQSVDESRRSFLSKLTRECLSQHVSLHRLHIQHSGKAMM